MRVFNMGGPCQSPRSDFLLFRLPKKSLFCFQDMRDMLPYLESEVLYNGSIRDRFGGRQFFHRMRQADGFGVIKHITFISIIITL